ncbi:zinc finger BED domain-containing protein RICESLEEPER 2-like [Humulus lupulus]|uniref:zinc finger BED domain-containing protein RICESLEEPER 2-like n=1 Tax=Humulus lupulus TaxID=3486 RepID=UPI002B40DAF5|nr:zinc finger BED domain-containing protein RICESLEEPER 2-like [Humulus lupulus]
MLPDCDLKKPRAACNYCGTNYAADTKFNGTSTLWAHVERKCEKCPFNDWVEKSKKQKERVEVDFCEAQSVIDHRYLCLTTHWVDDNWKMQKRIINFIQVPSHKGDLVGKELINCLNEWGISSVFTVTIDNASSNDVALKIKKALFNDAISSIRNAVRYVQSSPARLKRFKESCKDANMESKALLCLDVVTRWNSTYLMLEFAINFKKAFENLEADANYTKYFDEERMDGPPTNLDWEKAVVFVDFLSRFYDLTNRFSGSLYVTSNLSLPDILKIQADLTTMTSNPDTLLGAMAVSMKRKYDKYWGRIEKLNMLTFIANILDPRYKLEVVNRGFKFVYTSSEAEKMIKLLTNTLAQLYAFYKQQQPSQSSQAQPSQSQSQSQPSQLVINSTTESFLQWQLRLSDDIEEDSLEYHLSDRREKLDPIFDILQWWK